MNIVYLSTARIPSRDANSVHIMKMCAALATNGHDVTLIAPVKSRATEKTSQDGYSFYDVPKTFRIKRVIKPSGKYGDYLYALFVLMIVMFKKVDVFLSRNLLTSFITSWKKATQILELHQPIPFTSRVQSRMFDHYIVKRNFAFLVVITKPLKDIFVREYGLPAKKVLVAPDGADIKGPSPSEHKYETKLKVGYLGHLYKGRGVEVILEMASNCAWAEFHIAGGTEGDIQRVKKQCVSLKNVIVYGFVPPARAEQIRSEMHVLLAPYQRKVGLGSGTLTTEKWMSPLKVFEYMAAGKALICSDIPVLHEVLDPGKNCLMCPPDDIECWIQTLGQLKDDQSLRMVLGSQARSDILHKYSWKVRAYNMIQRVAND